MGVSSPTGNGETRNREFAGVPGTPLPLRPARAKANQAAAVKSLCSCDNARAADGNTDMSTEPIR